MAKSIGSIKRLSDGIMQNLQSKIDRTKALQSFLNVNVYAQYQVLQRTRWMTEGSSEGDTWKPVKPAYQKYKASRYAGFPGGGTKMLIRENKLQPSVIGPGDGFKKVVTNESLIISSGVEYAKYVDQERSFSHWSEESLGSMYKMITDFVWHNIVRQNR